MQHLYCPVRCNCEFQLIKDEIWVNPLQIFMMPDLDDSGEGEDSNESGEDADAIGS